jgi:fumarate reductase subunit C
MTEKSSYTAYHPRWYRSRKSTYWWLERRPYVAFILRELSSLFVAWFVVFLLLLIRAVGRGEPEYRDFLAWSASTPVLLVNLASLFFVGFHAITWFNLAPHSMVIRVGGRRVPGILIGVGGYLTWAAVSALVAWALGGW